jgi:hypothetical protein
MQQIIDHPPLGIEQKGIVRLVPAASRLTSLVVTRSRKVSRKGARDLEDAHVPHIEQARRPAHCAVFIQDGAVAQGHLPTGEGYEVGAQPLVSGIEGGTQKGSSLPVPARQKRGSGSPVSAPPWR